MQYRRTTESAARCPAGPRIPGARRENPPSRTRTLSWSFPGTPTDVSCSRRWLTAATTELWGEGDDTDRLALAYSEIATNAVLHGTGPVTVAARICPTGARCEIADRSPQVPRARHATSTDVGGRGLEMVRHTVDLLQVATGETGKTISFEVGRQAEDQDRADGPAGA